MRQDRTSRRAAVSFMGLLITTVYLIGPIPALAAPAPTELDSVPMVTIPEGPFLMGTVSPQGRADEWPQRTVQIDAFAIDQVEVTNERYMTFVAMTGHRNPPNPYGDGPLVSAKGSGCRLKPSGRRPLAGPMAANFPGAMSLRPGRGRISTGSGSMTRRCMRWVHCPVVRRPTEFMTCRATRGSGCRTGMTPTTMRTLQRRIRRVRTRALSA
jgi:hypothetical protein